MPCDLSYRYIRRVTNQGCRDALPVPLTGECEAEGHRSGPDPASPSPDAPGDSVSPRSRRCSAILGVVGALVLGRRRRGALPGDQHPDAQLRLPGPDDVRLLPRRQAAARHLLRGPEPRVDPARRRCRRPSRTPSSPRRTRPSGPTRASTPRASCARSFSNARGNARQGASTITQQYVKILYLTSERSYQRKIKEAVVSLKIQQELEQVGGPRGLPQHDLLRSRRLRHPGGLEGLLRPPRHRPEPARVRGPGDGAQQPDPVRPGQRQGRQAGPQGAATPTSSTAWPTWAASPPRSATRPLKRLPKFPEVAAQSQFGGQKGHMLDAGQEGAARQRHRLRGGDRRRWTAHHHHLRPRRSMADVQAGVLEQKPEGFGDKQLHIGAATRRGRHRRAARVLRRPGLPPVADQLGRDRRHGRLDDQAADGRRRASSRASRSTTPSTATRPTSSPTAPRCATRAPATDGLATTTARP